MLPLHTNPELTQCQWHKLQSQGGVRPYLNELILFSRAEVSRCCCIEGISHPVILGTVAWEVLLEETDQWGYVLPSRPNHCCGIQIVHFVSLRFSKESVFPLSRYLFHTSSFWANELILSARWGRCLSLPWCWRFTTFSFPNMSLR